MARPSQRAPPPCGKRITSPLVSSDAGTNSPATEHLQRERHILLVRMRQPLSTALIAIGDHLVAPIGALHGVSALKDVGGAPLANGVIHMHDPAHFQRITLRLV